MSKGKRPLSESMAREREEVYGRFPYGSIRVDEGLLARLMREDYAGARARERAAAISARKAPR